LCVAFVNLPNPPVLYCCVHLEIEALNENIGRWKTTWFTFIYCIYSILIWWGTASISYKGPRDRELKIDWGMPLIEAPKSSMEFSNLLLPMMAWIFTFLRKLRDKFIYQCRYISAHAYPLVALKLPYMCAKVFEKLDIPWKLFDCIMERYVHLYFLESI